MARKKRRSRTAQSEPVSTETDGRIEQFQRSAFWNLRTRIANVTIVIGALALLVVATGGAERSRLIPTLACAIAGACGLGVHAGRPYPVLARWLLISAVTLTVAGIVALLIVVGAGG
ncbi:hypothetical protein [Actinoplanes sp. HUAS TT8]|uniref:hypothetical protein n=1 Tax=Actinoplanes sp. HUAS TT8 TaxID=3447453 RepID=UPI003F522511